MAIAVVFGVRIVSDLLKVAVFYSKLHKFGMSFYIDAITDCWTKEEVNLHDPNRYLKWLAGSYKRSQRRNFPHAMSLSDFESLLLPKVCPVLSLPTNLGTGEGTHRLSIDRIVPELGYTPGNVIVVSTLANRIKGDKTMLELDTIARGVLP